MNRNKKKKLIWLTGVLAVVCVAAFVISHFEEKKEKIKNTDEVILQLDYDTVTALSWEYGDSALSFHKDETWVWDEDGAFPVNETKIRALLDPFREFSAAFRIDDVEDESQYGLDKPAAIIRITADGSDYTLRFGNLSKMDAQRYVSLKDGTVFLAAKDPLDGYEISIEKMIRNDVLPNLLNATKISFEGLQDYTLDREENSGKSWCADDVFFTDGRPVDTTKVNTYLKAISNLSLASYASYDAMQAELLAYGLDEPELTVRVTYPEGEESKTFVLCVGRHKVQLEQAMASESDTALDGVSAYFRIEGSGIIYDLSTASYKQLAACAYDDLRHSEILTADLETVTQIDILLEGESYSLYVEQVETDGVSSTVWHYTGEEEIDLSKLTSALTALSATEFTEDAAEGKEEIDLILHLNNERFPEIHLGLFRVDGEKCLAQIDGESLAFVSRSSAVNLIEAVNAIVLKK